MDLYFLLKKAVSIHIHPLTIAMELIVFGVVLMGFSRRRVRRQPGKFGAWLRACSGDVGMGLVIVGVFFLFLCSIKPVADPLVYSLEKRYPPLPVAQMTDRQLEEVAPAFIVVLGGGERYDPGRPPTSQLTAAAMARVNEAVRLAGVFPKATVVFTGRADETRAMTEFAQAMGVSPERILSESESRDTKDHPGNVRKIIGEAPFFLVTSGTHMPRAMMLFEAAGFRPTAAACDLWVWPSFSGESRYHPGNFIPSVPHLWMTHLAFHEYLGVAWIKLSGWETAPETESADPKEPSIQPERDTKSPVLPLPDKSEAPPSEEPRSPARRDGVLL